MAKDKEEQKQIASDFAVIGEYNLINAEKLDRAVNGTVMAEGQTKGGVGTDAEDAEVLAEYDRLGGLILKNNQYKVKTGSFYDFKAKKPFAKPQPILLFQINGETVEVPADEELPLEVRASILSEEKKAKRASKKRAKKEEEPEETTDEDEEGELA